MSTSSAPDGRGQVVTFYSFKGGVGRTMALANVAWILASRGKRVLAVDWDLEAPGLHSYFHPLLTDPELRDTDGLIDLLRAYQQAVLLPGREDVPQDDGWFRRTLDLTPYVVGLDLKFAGGGRLDFLPAGRQNAAYSDSVTSFDWHAFYGRLGGGKFLLEMREEMAARYDYVLIDSRTGVTDSSGICTVLLPDTLVLGFVYNVQNMRGSAHVARAVTKGSRRPIRLLPVPMRVEDAERERLEISRDRAREAFGTHLPWLDEGSVERYWGDVEIPYKTFYAYEEIVAPVGGHRAQGLRTAHGLAHRRRGPARRAPAGRGAAPAAHRVHEQEQGDQHLSLRQLRTRGPDLGGMGRLAPGIRRIPRHAARRHRHQTRRDRSGSGARPGGGGQGPRPAVRGVRRGAAVRRALAGAHGQRARAGARAGRCPRPRW